MENFDGLLIHIGGMDIQLHTSIINWLMIGLVLCLFFIIVGKKFETADERKAPKGILLIAEMIVGLCKSIIGDNLKESTRHYIPFFGTLIMMMAVSNLLGLLGLQPPTSNLSVNVTLALMMFLLIQFTNVKENGLVNRLKQWLDPFPFLAPLNIIGDCALPISLSLRLFGNLLAGTIIMGLFYSLLQSVWPFTILGYVVTPFLHFYFDIFSGLIQTYIFFTLASFFLSEAKASEEEA
ncbi:F0F1 ATP synthase subunit A [Copranaerobaculum intestinale]|uniref:F0F1 ATP synthase subunit A n=1 Tax=Copranaerobaculum intestinale TaxID=2692629 RepID=UPI003D316E4F